MVSENPSSKQPLTSTSRSLPPGQKGCQDKTTKVWGFFNNLPPYLVDARHIPSVPQAAESRSSSAFLPLYLEYPFNGWLANRATATPVERVKDPRVSRETRRPFVKRAPINGEDSAWELDFQVRPGESLNKFCLNSLPGLSAGNRHFVNQQLPGPVEHLLLAE